MVEVVRMHCLTLPLVLKREWYDLIDSGFKRVEFRRADYWLPRASKWAAKARSENLLPVIEFRHGYRPDARPAPGRLLADRGAGSPGRYRLLRPGAALSDFPDPENRTE